MESTSSEKPSKNNRINVSIDLRLVVFLLLAVIAAMLLIWKPWEAAPTDDDRTISVTGEADITAEPDEFVFRPSYEFKNASKEAALAQLTAKSNEVTKKLKELGVADSKIKADSDGYDYNYYYDSKNLQNNYTLRLTVIVGKRDQAQKVQDYLVSTAPQGSVSPNATFSDAKRKQLERQARDEATKDARAKADQSANNIGFKVGKVKSVSDGSSIANNVLRGGPAELSLEADSAVGSAPSLDVQPGENDLTYSVSVVYYLK